MHVLCVINTFYIFKCWICRVDVHLKVLYWDYICCWIPANSKLRNPVVIHNIGHPHLQTSSPFVFYLWGHMKDLVYQQKWRQWMHYYFTFWVLQLQLRTVLRKWWKLHIQFTRHVRVRTEAEDGHFEQLCKVRNWNCIHKYLLGHSSNAKSITIENQTCVCMRFLSGNYFRNSEVKTLSCEWLCCDVIFTLVEWEGYLKKQEQSYSYVLPDNIKSNCWKYVN